MTTNFEQCWKRFERCSKALGTFVLLAASAGAQPFDLEPVPHAHGAYAGYILISGAGPETVIAVGEQVVDAQPLGDGWLVGPLPPKGHRLTLWPDGAEAWQGRQIDVSASVPPADTVRVDLALSRVVITSVPYGAEVYRQAGPDSPRQYLGTTPFVHYDPSTYSGGPPPPMRRELLRFVVEKDGYAPEHVEVEPGADVRRELLLRPAPGAAPPGLSVYTYGEARTPGRRWVDYAAAGLAVAGAATAIYYKFEADGLDDRLRDPGDPARTDRQLEADLVARRDRLDAASLVGLGAMQLGVGVLAVRFVLR